MDACFRLKPGDRPAFSRPWGVLFRSVREAKRLLADRSVVAVGDMTSRSILDAGLSPSLLVVDGKIMRKKAPALDAGFAEVHVKNAKSTVSCALWSAVGDALSSGSPRKIVVDGEEDLAVIPAVMQAPEGTAVLYGQPGEGVVVILVSQSIREKFGRFLYEHLASLGERFIRGVDVKDKVLIIHHSDADGCSSGEMLARALRARGIKRIGFASPKLNPYITDDIKKRISREKPDTIIVADMGGDSFAYLEALAETKKVAVFDHHRVFNNIPKRFVLVNPNALSLPQSLNPSAAYLVYRSCKGVSREIDWLAVVGSIGDKGEKKTWGLVEEAVQKYGCTFETLRTCAKRIDSAEAFRPGGASVAIAALEECPTPDCLASGKGRSAKKLASWERLVREEINRLVQEHVRGAEFSDRPKLIVYEIRTPYGIKGDVANVLQELYPDHSALVYNRSGGKVRLSMRSSVADLSSAIRASVAGLDGKGGGHPRASGAEVAEGDFQKFLSNLRLRLMG